MQSVRLPGGIERRFNEASPMFAPDGRWVAYVSDESGRNEVYVLPFPGPGGKRQISTDGGGGPVWARDGRELFYLSGTQLMAVDIETDPTFRAGTPRRLFDIDVPGGLGLGRVARFDVTADGQRFVVTQDATTTTDSEAAPAVVRGRPGPDPSGYARGSSERDDAWLEHPLVAAPELNAHWAWFHVAEDEINHRGQIRWLRARLH